MGYKDVQAANDQWRKIRKREDRIQLDGKHHGVQRFYTPYPAVLDHAAQGAICFSKDENAKCGGTFAFNTVEPSIRIENYTADPLPNDSRTTCITCKFSGNPKRVDRRHYKVWCREAFKQDGNFSKAWKIEPYDLQSNPCRDWTPKGLNCIG